MSRHKFVGFGSPPDPREKIIRVLLNLAIFTVYFCREIFSKFFTGTGRKPSSIVSADVID
jgi:hypothetical protein